LEIDCRLFNNLSSLSLFLIFFGFFFCPFMEESLSESSLEEGESSEIS